MHKYHKGAVSLFIVVFFSLLITVFTVSFARLTIKGLQQSTTANLSQNAYDSAQAGVEDAKRALIRLGVACTPSPSYNAANCASYSNSIFSTTCNQALTGLVDVTATEVKVQQTSGDVALDQAYTCVTIVRNTLDYLGSLKADESKTVPINGVSNFDRVQIEWFNSGNVGGSNTISLLRISDISTNPFSLIPKSNYPTNRPPVLRAHFIKAPASFDPTALETATNSATMFLYPITLTTSNVPIAFTDGGRKIPDKKPTLVQCYNSLATVTYSCSIELILPGAVTTTDTALLQLTSLYNLTDYKISLCNGSCSNPNNIVRMNGVQPMIDSTGRANDLFRRVQVRVEGVDSFPYPDAAVEVTGNFCKNFWVTDQVADYSTSGCTP